MVLLLVAGLALVAVAGTLVARAVAMPRSRVAETLGRIDEYGFDRSVAAPVPTADGPLRRLADPLAGALGTILQRRLPSLGGGDLRAELVAAGLYDFPVRRLVGYRVLATLGAPLLWLWASGLVGVTGLLRTLVFVVLFAVGWRLPVVLVRTRAERRLKEIDHELPELIDVLVVTVEAGLGFSASLQTAAARFTGPLGDELRLALQEQRMGLTATESLRNMLERCDTPGMRSFVRSVVQGETLGVSIGQIMRDLAVDMRKRRRQAAEEKAHKAPIKILFPLVFLIFPAMFVVLLLPAVLQFMDAF